MAFGRDFCQNLYPASPTPYRYVNSGCWIGRAAAAYRLFTTLVGFTPGLDDQHVVNHIFVSQSHRFEVHVRALLTSQNGDLYLDGGYIAAGRPSSLTLHVPSRERG
jgi:hypothetical protein